MPLRLLLLLLLRLRLLLLLLWLRRWQWNLLFRSLLLLLWQRLLRSWRGREGLPRPLGGRRPLVLLPPTGGCPLRVGRLGGATSVADPLAEAALGEVLLDHLVLRPVVADEGQERLAGEGRALVAFEGRLRPPAQPVLHDLVIEVLRAVVVVQGPQIQQDLVADLAVVRLRLVQGPLRAKLLPHQPEDGAVGEAKVSAQVDGVPPLEGAVGTVVGAPVGDLLKDQIPEMAQEVHALVSHLRQKKDALVLFSQNLFRYLNSRLKEST